VTITYTWTYTDCEGNTQDYVHTVTIEYDPFPAIPPTTDVVDCYANIVLPAAPVVADNCGVTLTPTGPVETGTVVCEGDITYTWTYTDCEGNTQDYVHTVTMNMIRSLQLHRQVMWLIVMQILYYLLLLL
jgi:hypothetical protein